MRGRAQRGGTSEPCSRQCPSTRSYECSERTKEFFGFATRSDCRRIHVRWRGCEMYGSKLRVCILLGSTPLVERDDVEIPTMVLRSKRDAASPSRSALRQNTRRRCERDHRAVGYALLDDRACVPWARPHRTRCLTRSPGWRETRKEAPLALKIGQRLSCARESDFRTNGFARNGICRLMWRSASQMLMNLRHAAALAAFAVSAIGLSRALANGTVSSSGYVEETR